MSNANEPAFPLADASGRFPDAPGLTKREYAAIQIMAGLSADRDCEGVWKPESIANMAHLAIERADILLTILASTDQGQTK